MWNLLSAVCVMPPKVGRSKRRVTGKTSKQERLGLQRKHKTVRRAKRRIAFKELLDVAAEVGVSVPRVDRAEPTSADVTRLIRVLYARELPAETTARVRTAAQKWLDGHGELDAELLESDSDEDDDEHESPSVVLQHAILKPTFKLHSKAFMLTYNSREFTTGDWREFRKFVKKLRKSYGARAWAASLEESLHASEGGAQKVYHLHAYLFWLDGVGVSCRDLSPFFFKDVRPRVDVCRERKAADGTFSAACHGLWYVSFPKTGTVFNATNYVAWKMYKPKVEWVQDLWREGKVSHEYYLKVSAEQFRVGHSSRRRDVEEVCKWEREEALQTDIAAELRLLESDQALQEPRPFEQVATFIAYFGRAAWRRPLLVVVGPTNTGKSMLAGHVLKKVAEVLGVTGFLEITVEMQPTLDFSEFNRKEHAGVLLDGVGDVLILKANREALQGRPKMQKGGQSATNVYSYPFSLCKRAVVATLDSSAANLHMLTTDHWLSNPANVLQLWLTSPAWAAPGEDNAGAQEAGGVTWGVDAVASFLEAADLSGPAHVCRQNGVNGADLASFTLDTLQQELKLSPFAAKKIIKARDDSGLF